MSTVETSTPATNFTQWMHQLFSRRKSSAVVPPTSGDMILKSNLIDQALTKNETTATSLTSFFTQLTRTESISFSWGSRQAPDMGSVSTRHSRRAQTVSLPALYDEWQARLEKQRQSSQRLASSPPSSPRLPNRELRRSFHSLPENISSLYVADSFTGKVLLSDTTLYQPASQDQSPSDEARPLQQHTSVSSTPHQLSDASIDSVNDIEANPERRGSLLDAIVFTVDAIMHHKPASYDQQGNLKFNCQRGSGRKKMRVKVYEARLFQQYIWTEDELSDLKMSFKNVELKKMKAGKSGSYLIWSQGSRYLAKSLQPGEISTAKRMMADYPKHLHNNPDSLLVRILGLLRIEEPGRTPKYFALMRNVAPPHPARNLFFDLKGSTHGRRAKPSESIKKDVDFIDGGYSLLSPTTKLKLGTLTQLHRDVAFLRQYDVIDYSLFCGLESDGAWCGGIIDIFTRYNSKKRLEKWVIGSLHNNISCQDPHIYSRRFVEFIERCLISS